MIEVVCGNCNRHFLRHPSKATSPTGKVFCNEGCHNEYRLRHIYKCDQCSKVFHGGTKHTRFCSRDCATKRRKIERNPLNCACALCGKLFHKTPYAISHGEGKFCSFACKSSYQTGRYDGSGPVHYYSLAKWRKIRAEVIERDKSKCTVCGSTEGPLHVNHIYFRELGGSDHASNLETLCRRCHAKVDAQRLKDLTANPKARMRDYKATIDTIKKLDL